MSSVAKTCMASAIKVSLKVAVFMSKVQFALDIGVCSAACRRIRNGGMEGWRDGGVGWARVKTVWWWFG